MAIIQPGTGRALIEPEGAGLRITIPAATHAFATAFMGLWLIGWAFGEVSVIYLMLYPAAPEPPNALTNLFLLAWLALWTMGGAWCIATLLWNLAGKEVIELTSTTLKHRKQIPVFSRSRDYAVASIANLRLTQGIPPAWYEPHNMTSSLTFKDGAIAFDYGRSTHHLGSELDEADAKHVIREMCKRVKLLCNSQ